MPPAGYIADRPGILSLAKKSFRLLAGAFLLWIGIVLAWTGGSGTLSEQRYRNEASTVRARVVRKSLQPATSSQSTRYEVTYRTILPNAPPVERTETVDVSAWERLESGSELELQYLADRPESVRIAREPEVVGNAVPLGIGIVLTAVGGALATLGVRDVRRRIHLYDHGTPGDAVVNDVEETNVRINRRVQWRIRYTYRDHLGRERRGESPYLSAEEALEWHPGDTGRVLYDRERPELVLWVGKQTGRSS